MAARGIPARSGLKRGIALLRVSTPRQMHTDYDPEGISLPTQREAIQAKAKEVGALLIDEYVEPGNTGTTMAKRPVFRQMMQRIRTQRDVDYVITYNTSRMHRNWKENGAVLLELQQLGVKLISATEPIDGDTAVHEAMQGMLAVFNGFQSRANGEDIKRKMAHKAEKGGTLHRAPIGYLNVIEEVDGRYVRTVKIDDVRGPLVRLAFEWYATGSYTLRSLREKLNDAGLRAKPHGSHKERPISLHLVGNMLQDRYYLGLVEWDGLEYQGRHEPLVSQELFDRVQRVLFGDRRAGKRERTHDHYLRGVVWCARCQSRLIIMTGRSKSGIQYHYYICRGRQERTCDLPYLHVQKVERAVAERYATVQLPEEYRERAEAVMRTAAAERYSNKETLRAQLERQLQEIERKEDHYFDLVGDPAWPKAKLAVRMAALQEERERVEMQLAAGPTDVQSGLDTFVSALRLLSDPQALYAEASVPAKKVLNKAIFTKLYVEAEGEAVSVVDDDLNEPFATAVYARRADSAALSTPDLRAALDEALRAAEQPAHSAPVRERSGRVATAPRFTAAASLVHALHGRCSSNAALVGRTGLEPVTDRL